MTELNRRQALAHLAIGTGALAAVGLACGSSQASADASAVGGDAPDAAADATAPSDAPDSAEVDAPADISAGPPSTVDSPIDPAEFSDDTCILAPAMGAGPYYFSVDQLRRDITEGKPGTALRLGFRVMDQNCEPIPDALVDIWHCDALGYYAGFADADPDEGVPAEITPDEDETFLRGIQPTDTDGIADFATIYPGFYRIRAVHIHVKVHLNDNELITTQAYLDDSISDRVYEEEPYSERTVRDVYNSDERASAEETMAVREVDGGYRATITLQVRRT
jgi:protocatechuate 3,4-dioxygenase beta subunit